MPVLIRRIKNNSGADGTWRGQLIFDGDYYEIQNINEYEEWVQDEEVAADVLSGDLVINDGTSDIVTLAQAQRLFRHINSGWLRGKPLEIGLDTPSDNAIMSFDSSNDEWVEKTVADILGGDNLPSVNLCRTTDFNISNSFQDITFNTTEVENQPTVIEHDNTNTERINTLEDGLYMLSYNGTVHDPESTVRYDFRVLKNNTTELACSQSSFEFNDSGGNDSFTFFPCSNTFPVDLLDGDYITLQVKSDSNSPAFVEGGQVNFSLVRLRGTPGEDGEVGPTGAGANIIVQKDDVTVGTVTDTLNFEGGVTVVDDGGNKTTVTVNAATLQATATSTTSTNSGSYVLVPSMTFTPPAGNYLVSFSCWGNGTNANQTKYVSLYQNGSIINHTIRRADGDMNNGQRFSDFPFHTQAVVTLSGSEAIEARFSTSSGTFTIDERSLILLKVG